MSIASEITRLQTSKADIKTQVNIDKEWINKNTDFITSEKLDEYDSKILNMQDAYKQYIPIYTKMTASGNTTQNGTPTPSSPVPVNNVTGEQVVRVCGKNLLQHSAYDGSLNGITLKVNNDKSITLTGTATANTNFNIGTNADFTLGAGTYTFSKVATNVQVLIYYSSASVLANLPIGTQTKTFTLNNDTTYNNYRVVISIPNGTTVNETVYPMLEKGTSATSYEPYQGKDYEINLGKNLADISQIQIGKSWSNENYAQRATILYIPIEKGKSYYLISTHTNSAITSVRAVVNHGINDKTNCYVVASFPYTNNNWEYVSIEVLANTTFTSEMLNGLTIQLEQSTTETDYAPYFTPTELNKIGDYQDYIKKGTGKNLINVSNNTRTTNGVTCSWNNNFAQISGTNTKTDANWILLNTANFDFPDFKIGETYTISALGKSNKCYVQINYNVGDTTTQKALVTMDGESKSFIVPEDFGRINFIFIGIYRTTGAINENWYLQIEKGSNATYYEPYGYKDKWYIEKNVGKVVLNGTETNWYKTTDTSTSVFVIPNKFNDRDNTQIAKSISNYFKYQFANIAGKFYFGSTTNVAFCMDTTYDLASFKSWLSTHNTTIYYVLANPTYTLIENEELIEQLEAVQLQTGENNVLVSGDLPMILDLSKYIQIVENHL